MAEETGQSLYGRWTTFLSTKPKIADVVGLLDVPELRGTVTEYLRITLQEDTSWWWNKGEIFSLLSRLQDPEILNFVLQNGNWCGDATFDELVPVMRETESGSVAHRLEDLLSRRLFASISSPQNLAHRVSHLACICETAKTMEAREVAGRCLIALHERVVSEGNLNRRLLVELGLVVAAARVPETVKGYLLMDPEHSMVPYDESFLSEDPLCDRREPRGSAEFDAPEFLPIAEFMLALVLEEDEWAVGSFRSALYRGRLEPPISQYVRAATTARNATVAKMALEQVFEHGGTEDLFAILRDAESSSVREEFLAILSDSERFDLEEMSDAELLLISQRAAKGLSLRQRVHEELARRPSWHASEIRRAAGVERPPAEDEAPVGASCSLCFGEHPVDLDLCLQYLRGLRI